MNELSVSKIFGSSVNGITTMKPLYTLFPRLAFVGVALCSCVHERILPQYAYWEQISPQYASDGNRIRTEKTCYLTDMANGVLYKQHIVSLEGLTGGEMITTEMINLHQVASVMQKQSEIWRGKTFQLCDWEYWKKRNG